MTTIGIRCGFMGCEANATHREVVVVRPNRMAPGVAFYYYCSRHATVTALPMAKPSPASRLVTQREAEMFAGVDG